jgi:hypothetical protein
LDSFTGGQLVIAADMPVVCSAGFTTSRARELIALAGLKQASMTVPFRAGEELAALSRVDPNAKLVFQHAFPSEAPEAARCWIDRKLLSWLNNKGNLAALAPAEHVPLRRVANRAEFFAASSPPLPAVLKVVTDQSSGGGFGIRICRNEAELQHARKAFRSCGRIVVERLLEIIRNPCLSFVVTPEGQSHFIGFADQDITVEGKHRGNWAELGSTLPDSVIKPALEVIRRAAALGYRGFAGVDVAVTRDERIYILDLNFRLNASTACVLLAPSLEERLGAASIHFSKIQGHGTANQLANALEPFVRSGHLVPLSLFDPLAAGYPVEAPFAQALIIGSSRSEVRSIERRVKASLQP